MKSKKEFDDDLYKDESIVKIFSEIANKLTPQIVKFIISSDKDKYPEGIDEEKVVAIDCLSLPIYAGLNEASYKGMWEQHKISSTGDIPNHETESTRYEKLTNRHKGIMNTKNTLISVYTNASGFLWSMMMVDSGTDLGWCGMMVGNCKESGSFKTYEDALEDAINLIEKCDFEKFKKDCPSKEFHCGNYADWLNKNYRKG